MTFQLFSFLFMVFIILLFYKDATRCTKFITKFINTNLSCKFTVMYFQNTAGCSLFWAFWICPRKALWQNWLYLSMSFVSTTMFKMLKSKYMDWMWNEAFSRRRWKQVIDISVAQVDRNQHQDSKIKNIMLMLFANDMCNLWLNRFGSWDKVVKFDANNLYLQNNKRQT